MQGIMIRGWGEFLSVDSVQGNGQGMDPYAYVGGNPETEVDPSGNIRGTAGGGGDPGSQPCAIPGSCGTIKAGGGSGDGSGSGSGGTTTQPNPPSPPHRPTSQHKKQPLKGNGCDLQCHAAKAAAALHAQDAKALAFNSLVADGATLFTDVLSMIVDASNTAALVIDIVTSFIPHLLQMIGDFITFKGGTVPPLLQGLMAVGDALAGVANVIKSFAIFAFSVSGVISHLAFFAEQSLKEIMVSAVSSLGSSVGSFIGMSNDVINLQDSNINNVWTSQQIIDHCQEAGLSSCG